MVPSMADAESRREPGPAAAAGESRAETDVRPARTLGRGLAELSPLFLSHRRVDVPVVTKPLAPGSPAVPLAPASPAASLEPAAPAAPAAPATPAPALSERNTARRRSGTLLLRPASDLTREQVVASIQAAPNAVEARLRAIDTGVAGGPGGPIDVLALDDGGRLVVIDADLSATGSLLVRGLDHTDWIARNLAVLFRTYRNQPIDFSAPPRLVLVAHDFSRALRNAIRQIAVPEVSCVRCHGLDVSGWTGIFFE